MNDNFQLNQGDVVKLKGQDVHLTVDNANELNAFCVWFDEENKLCSKVFKKNMLERVEKPSKIILSPHQVN